LGKIFKALEKSQQTIENSENIKEKFEAEPLPLLSDQENVHKTEIATRPVTIDPMLVTIDPMLVTIDPMLVTGLSPQSMESEQFRLLKNNILFPEKGTVPKCIMVTSTAPGEGKSFVAANLAITLSQSIDEYVLLMDCDLRSPTIHSMFGYNDNAQGLSEYLSKAKPLSSLLVNSFLDKLTILPAGQIPPNPSELLSSEQMRRLIHEVKLRYSDRYIIIDTPPPSLTSETSVISRQVDGIVIVIKQGQTRKKDILNVIDIYGREKILGIVYNFANKPIGYGYGKYGYGKYGYGVKNA
jgi:protein-tyrosine kinase